MKLIYAILILFIAAAPAATHVVAQPSGEEEEVLAERAVAATPDVVVELSLASGDVVVRGWDRKEVRARSEEAPRIEMRQYDTDSPKEAGKGTPARRVEIFVLSSKEDEMKPGEVHGSGNVELTVPHGATVVLRVQSGDVEISDVADARIECMSGDVDISGITKSTQAQVFSGDLSLSDSRGGVMLRSMSGMVEATNVNPNDSKDFFTIKSVSGNISLDGVTHAKVESETMSGSVHFEGTLAPGGGYKLQTHSGDVTMTLPPTSSFKVNARIVFGGEIITDFPVKSDARTEKSVRSRLDGIVGTGDADISLTSFNGTVHLRRK